MTSPVDPRLDPFIFIAEVSDAECFIGRLFGRKFGGPPPRDYGHHMVAFYVRGDGALLPASYLHVWMQGSIGLVGGGCTDGAVIGAMTPEEQLLVAQAGGLLLQTLRYCFARFGPRLDAFFGHCGSDRALEVDLRAGFRRTHVPYLLERHNRELPNERQEELLRQAQAVGNF